MRSGDSNKPEPSKPVQSSFVPDAKEQKARRERATTKAIRKALSPTTKKLY